MTFKEFVENQEAELFDIGIYQNNTFKLNLSSNRIK
jgi:hypothetical protein